MRYFLIASITFHTTLFVAWPASDDGNRAGDVPALSLVINKHNDSLRTSLNDRSRQDQPLHRQYDTPAAMEEKRQDPVSATTPVETDGVDNTTLNQIGSSNESQMTEDATESSSGTRIQAHLKDAFIPYFNYPKLAREKGWQGTVELMVYIDAQSQLTQVRLIRSSGYGVLDHAAIASLNHVKALPLVMQWLDNHGFEMVFPVKYQLIDT